MALTRSRVPLIALMLLAGFVTTLAQTMPTGAAIGSTAPQPSVVISQSTKIQDNREPLRITSPVASPLQPLLDFKESDIKFNLQALMNTLRDNRHEGWVLAAYPDPKTSRPLIGAGFSLDLPAREHPQSDPLNPNQFLEPSSAQLWEAAGLEPQHLQAMLEQFNRELSTWKKQKFRHKVRTQALFPEISEEDAIKLLRISTIQAVHNARAYCRDFDRLTGPQQMALTQLVFQMGVNLKEFTQFLFAINHHASANSPETSGASIASASFAPGQKQPVDTLSSTSASSPALGAESLDAAATMAFADDAEYWKAVQETLIHSDWARRYSTRAVSVIAMFNPEYQNAPWAAEAKVRAEVHPLHSRRRRAATVRNASTQHRRSAARRTHKS